ISRSRYYQRSKDPVSRRALEDGALESQIQEIYAEGRGSYGSPRIFDELLKRGYRLSRKRVIRLMHKLGLKAKTAKKFKVTTDSNHTLPIADNLLKRQFSPPSANQAWVSDITYLRTQA